LVVVVIVVERVVERVEVSACAGRKVVTKAMAAGSRGSRGALAYYGAREAPTRTFGDDEGGRPIDATY
jgi:hypothetical protein